MKPESFRLPVASSSFIIQTSSFSCHALRSLQTREQLSSLQRGDAFTTHIAQR
jgi:hypothetical protein